jgi:aldehyde dehydrogenase (NAD+)
VRPGIGVEITREPIGVVGLITPWNFPIAIPAWKIAPALAFGNCVVLKPADLVPGSAWALADIIHRSASPPACSTWSWAGPRDRRSPGQPRRCGGHQLHRLGGRGPRHCRSLRQSGKKVQLEMGGKNPRSCWTMPT